MNARAWIAAAALLAFAGVALGAFGAHGLKGRVTADELAIWSTAVQYHTLHALALLAFGIWRERSPGTAFPAFAFVTGIVLFSGSLYWMALDGPRWLGPVTPIGGAAFLAGWLALAVSAWRGR